MAMPARRQRRLDRREAGGRARPGHRLRDAQTAPLKIFLSQPRAASETTASTGYNGVKPAESHDLDRIEAIPNAVFARHFSRRYIKRQHCDRQRPRPYPSPQRRARSHRAFARDALPRDPGRAFSQAAAHCAEKIRLAAKRRAETMEENRAKFIGVARRAFAASGFDNASMDDLTAEVGQHLGWQS